VAASLSLLTPAMQATVCNFDDLPQVQSGALSPIPAGYCGVNWYGENGVGYYFTTSTQYLGTFSPYSKPNATALFASNTYGFSFVAPAVFNGFWAVPATYYANPNAAQLQIQVILSLNGNTVYTTSLTAVSYPNAAFISSGYSGMVDTVVINSLGYYAKYGQYTAGGFFSIDDVTFNSICGTPSIAPSTLQNFPASGGTGTATVTYPVGCAWTATSGSSWISITNGASGTGNGSVAYTVAANSPGGGYREGSLTIAGLSLPVQEAGTVQFQAAGGTSNGGSGTSDVIGGSMLSYSGSTWPIDGGPITVQDSAGSLPSPSYQPPNFSDSSYQVVFPFSSTPPCTSTITASQGTLSQSVTLTGIYLGKVVLDDDSNNYQVGKQFCRSNKLFMDISGLTTIQVAPGKTLAIETYPSDGGSSFFVNNQEAVLTPSIFIAINPGQTLTLPLANGGSSTVTADATSPLPASLFVAPQGVVFENSLAGILHISGDYQLTSDLNSSSAIVLDNAVIYVAGNVTINGGISGIGSIIATGNISVNGPVTLVPSGDTLFAAGGGVSISAPARTGSCTQQAQRVAAFGPIRGRPAFYANADVNGDGVVDVSDVQQTIDQALGTTPPTSDINADGVVNAVDVQIVVNAALVSSCSAQ
jgi:hypothetical protein